jgi:acyl transferase domain-containing protein
VASLHSETLNPQIDFASTPFKVQQGLSEWKRPVIIHDGQEREYPRIAGISSFGAGGANAHVIVEEYCTPPDARLALEITAEHPALILLSAKSEAQLQTHAKQLLAHIAGHSYAESDLVNIAYTLQIGREAMEQRIAFTATTIKELQEHLAGYIEGKG